MISKPLTHWILPIAKVQEYTSNKAMKLEDTCSLEGKL